MDLTAREAPALALAAASEALPLPTSMRGGAWYEPKWDGFRLAVSRHRGQTTLWSRHGTDLTSRFPDLAAVAAKQVPDQTVLDGEVVAWVGDRLDFTALQRRMGGSSATIARAARRWPVSYVAFDALTVRGLDVRERPYLERRDHLQGLAQAWSPPMHITPVTDDVDVARTWFTELAAAGVEGLVVKAGAAPYRAGRRDWVKVKRRDTLDVVCGAVLGPVQEPVVLVVGVPVDGTLRIVGASTVLSAPARRALRAVLHPAGEGHPWPVRVRSTTVAGFARDRREVDLTLVEPVVVEVTADVAWSGRAFRHPVRFVRARPDIDPNDVAKPGTRVVSP